MKIFILSALLLVYTSSFAQKIPQTDNGTGTQNPTTSNGNTTTEYNAWVLNTNFTVPILRINFLYPPQPGQDDKKVNVAFFNSVGAGIGYYFGKLTRTEDSGGNLISQDLTNIFGVQFGFLFAANPGTTSTTMSSTTTVTSNTSSTNIFGITGAISILNFQIGGGYDLGTVAPGQRRGFMTVAYSIPLTSLIKGGFLVTSKTIIDAGHRDDALF